MHVNKDPTVKWTGGAGPTHADIAERDIELEMGDDYQFDMRKTWDLANPEEKYDIIPEIWQGHNVADFIDPDIMKKLDELEKEEEMREKAGYYDSDSDEEDETMKDIRKTAKKIREKRKIIMMESREKRRVEKPRLPRSAQRATKRRMEQELGELGIEMDSDDDQTHVGRMRSRSASRKALKRKREASMEVDTARSRSQSMSKPPRDMSGVRDVTMAKKAKKIAKKAQVPRNREAKKGEGDRVILNMKPKHLYAGKRKQGKTSRR